MFFLYFVSQAKGPEGLLDKIEQMSNKIQEVLPKGRVNRSRYMYTLTYIDILFNIKLGVSRGSWPQIIKTLNYLRGFEWDPQVPSTNMCLIKQLFMPEPENIVF